ncbi:MAG: metallophosphoesterase [Elusimicrobia bacterium CG03_land_8_20_14_0_80_50_18]|nr:MAG: metallophosphoesterase [Elusimicrobia bacterium CG03_land_8_20_14_0_80_50_18]PIX15481.1 MAG: metallophosphoesterase [Elusimicrobia bacterium CG_4_8_14_3_um_filter_50_9]
MKIGIFSDIHGNLPAFEAVLTFLEGKVEKYVCCGDIVGYGPYPNECVEKISELSDAICVAGNHDWAVLGLEDLSKFNDEARASLEWTKKKLSPASASFLMGLDYKLAGAHFIAVHGSLIDPLDQYVKTAEDYIPSMKKQDRNILFVGHSHQPLYFRGTGGSVDFGAFIPLKPVDIEAHSKYLINVGSVGQPRDGNPRAACVIYDEDAREAVLHRIEYDVPSVQKAVLDAGLPPDLAERLGKGA